MTAAADFDPYLLPLPAPASPVVPPHLASPLHAHLNGRYGDPVWPLAPLTGNPSTRKPRIHWEHWPAAFRDEMRLAAWNLINGQLRPTFLRGHSPRMRGRPSMTEVNGTLAQWRQLARWLEERGISSLAGCDAGVLHDYGQHLRDSGQSRKHVLVSLVALTRLWALDQLSARPNGIACPPWEDLGLDDYLPAATSAGGGRTRPSPSRSRPWARCSSGRCGWSRTCPGTSSPAGPSGSASSRQPAPLPRRPPGSPPWRHTSAP